MKLRYLIIICSAILILVSITAFIVYRGQRYACPSVNRITPLALPQYPNTQQEVSSERMAGATHVQDITFQTTDTAEGVIAFYKDRLNSAGWKLSGQEDNAVLVFSERKALPIYGILIKLQPGETNLTSVSISLSYGPCVIA